MSRIAKFPVTLPKGVEATLAAEALSIKGPLGTLSQRLRRDVSIEKDGDKLGFKALEDSDESNLTMGFSHPVVHPMPKGVKVETPSQTEIVIKGLDKQLVGQVAAEVRAYRSPEPYKGKGVRYSNERVILKETKKK